MDRLGPASTLEPVARLACLALLSSASLLGSAPFSALLSLAFVGLLMRQGLRFRTILRDSAFVVAFTIFTAIIRYGSLARTGIVPFAEMMNVGSYGVRLLAAFLVGRLFYASTGVSELRDAATRIARRIPILKRYDIGLLLSMVLTFIPLIFEEWTASREVARARGMPRRSGISRQAIVISAFLRRLMLRAVATPEALSARGWSRDRGIAPLLWRKRDISCLLACSGIFLATLIHLV